MNMITTDLRYRCIGCMRFLISLLLVLICQPLRAQDSTALPATDIYLLDISRDKKGLLQFQNPVRITKNENYDNVPWFYPDGSAILYAAVHDSSAGDSSKSDIYKYDLRTQKTTVIINTPKMAEYSPMVPPNKVGVSVVRVLEDNVTQILARCDDKTDECINFLPKQKKVAYYVWMDASRVAYVIVDDPMRLLMTTLSTGKTDTIAEDVGRCVQKVPGKNVQISYVDKGSNPWTIKVYDGKSKKISIVVETIEDQEDYCYMPDGSLLMGDRTELYHFIPPTATSNMASAHTSSSKQNSPPNSKTSPASSKGQPAKPEKPKEEKSSKKGRGPWVQVATFRSMAVYQFYRIAVSPQGDKLAVVTYPDEKP